MSSPVRAAPATVAPPDAELVLRVAGGDLSGLGMLFDRYANDVRRLLGRLGVATADLDDLVQLAFLDIIRAASRFQATAPVKPWIFGIAVILVRRHRRHLGRAAERLRAWALEREEELVPPASAAFEVQQEAARAARALMQLSHRKRETFVLVAMQGLSGEEAASALQIPVATVWTRLHHARRELRELLSREGG